MNKAKITYRFDHTGRYEEGSRHEEENRHKEENRQGEARRGDLPESGRVIPLHKEEYRVMQEPEIQDYQGLNQYTTDYGAWDSPFDAETERIERLIRQSDQPQERKRRPASGREHFPQNQQDFDDREQFDDQQQFEEQWEGPAVTGSRYVRHNRVPWLKISLSIAGAAVTGILLGVLVLSLFSGWNNPLDGLAPERLAAELSGDNSLPVVGNPDDPDNQSDSLPVTGNAITLNLGAAIAYPGKTYSFLQHGVFSAQEGATQAENDLVSQGLAAASEYNGHYSVFAGVTPDKESATQLSMKLREQNKLDIYVKPYEVPAINSVNWDGDVAVLESYLIQSDSLLQSINSLTVMNLEPGSVPTPIEASTLESVGSAHTSWSQLSTKVAQEAGDANKAVVARMNNAMNSAKISLDEYRKNPSAAMLWQAQTYTLQFIIAQKELIEGISL